MHRGFLLKTVPSGQVTRPQPLSCPLQQQNTVAHLACTPFRVKLAEWQRARKKSNHTKLKTNQENNKGNDPWLTDEEMSKIKEAVNNHNYDIIRKMTTGQTLKKKADTNEYVSELRREKIHQNAPPAPQGLAATVLPTIAVPCIRHRQALLGTIYEQFWVYEQLFIDYEQFFIHKQLTI